MKNRPSFEKWCMQIAQSVSLRSPDPKLQVGAILVSGNFKKILGWGYNGPISNHPNKRRSNKPGKSGFIHSEINCLINSAENSHGILFVTTAPCEQCAQIIANSSKVTRVYYNKEYRNNKGIKILSECNILCSKIEV